MTWMHQHLTQVAFVALVAVAEFFLILHRMGAL